MGPLSARPTAATRSTVGQRARRAVRVWNGDDGMVHLYGQFDPVTGRRIRNRLNKEAHRLHDGDKKQARGLADAARSSDHGLCGIDKMQGRGLTGTDENSARGLYDADGKQARGGGGVRSLPQCMADAFDNMTAGTVGGGRPYADIALVARLDDGAEELMVSTADGDPLPAAVVERLAGESSWFGMVLSARGVPMWKGRNIRRATESQFQALMTLYGGCAGCGEPDENMLHAHHMDPFAWGGRTDLDNLMPLCWGCHAKIHDHHWQVVRCGRRQAHHQTPRPHPPRRGAPARHRSPIRSDRPGWSVPSLRARAAGRARKRGRSSAVTGPAAAGSGSDARGGTSSNGSQAGPIGPQAARDALRKARVTPRRVPAAQGLRGRGCRAIGAAHADDPDSQHPRARVRGDPPPGSSQAPVDPAVHAGGDPSSGSACRQGGVDTEDRAVQGQSGDRGRCGSDARRLGVRPSMSIGSMSASGLVADLWARSATGRGRCCLCLGARRPPRGRLARAG